MSTQKLTAVDGVCLLVRDFNAEFLYKRVSINGLSHEQLHSSHTSSMAITTSTVSKLSSPRSFEK